jgi:hypothetical protein
MNQLFDLDNPIVGKLTISSSSAFLLTEAAAAMTRLGIRGAAVAALLFPPLRPVPLPRPRPPPLPLPEAEPRVECGVEGGAGVREVC